MKLENIKKIAVLRANALGDFIVTLPALQAIRDTYPDAEIVLLGKPWHKEFIVQNRTPVDRVMVVPVKAGIRNEPGKKESQVELETFFNAMQKEQFDIAISFQGNGKSANPFIKKFNAKYTVGLISEGAESLDFSLNYYYYQSETVRFIEVASLIGAKPAVLEPGINIMQQDKDEVKLFKEELDGRYIVLHAIATDVRRMWPIENYAPLADALKQQDFEVVFTGSKEDKILVDQIQSEMKYQAVNACGLFSLGGLTALLADADLVISADTGPLHLARAVKAPTIGIYWAPNLINWGPVTRDIHRPVISWVMACSLCGIIPNNPYPFEPQSDCKHEVSFVKDVTVEAVLREVKSIMAFIEGSKNIISAVAN